MTKVFYNYIFKLCEDKQRPRITINFKKGYIMNIYKSYQQKYGIILK